jgi:hypothetical protein
LVTKEQVEQKTERLYLRRYIHPVLSVESYRLKVTGSIL